jgi:hypothetical protein
MLTISKTSMPLAFLALAFAPAAFAGFNVRVAPVEGAQQVALSFTTTETHSSMCHLATKELTIVAPKIDFATGEQTRGQIKVSASVDPGSMCLMAFGPHRGGLTFTRGNGLPNLVDGAYDVTINGLAVGRMTLAEAAVTFAKVEETGNVRRFSGDMIAGTLLDALRLYVETNGVQDGVSLTADHGVLVTDPMVDEGTSLKCFEQQAGPMLPAFSNVCEVTLSERAADGVVEGSLISSVVYEALLLYNQQNPGTLAVDGDQLTVTDDLVAPGASVKAYQKSAGPHLPAFTYVVEFQFPPN